MAGDEQLMADVVFVAVEVAVLLMAGQMWFRAIRRHNSTKAGNEMPKKRKKTILIKSTNLEDRANFLRNRSALFRNRLVIEIGPCVRLDSQKNARLK